MERFGLDQRSSVVELASNDGYLLRNFVARGIPALGIEPAANVAAVAVRQGVPTRSRVLRPAAGRGDGATKERRPICCSATTCSPRFPTSTTSSPAWPTLLKPTGVITMEFPHLLRLMQGNQFDTIYHEHFSYFSFLAAEKIFARPRI